MTRALHILLLALIATAAAATSAAAQIFTARDANGTTVLSNSRVERPTKVFPVAGAPSYRTTTAGLPGRAAAFEDLVIEHAQRQSLRPELVRAIIQVESGFDPGATSPKGAMGLMQLMPGTATRFGVRDVWDPVDNLSGGMAYLSWLIDFYGGDLARTLAGYNAGEQAVERYGGVPPYAETEAYVARITSDLGVATHAAGLAASPLHAVFIPEPVREAYLRASSTLSSSCCQVARLPPS